VNDGSESNGPQFEVDTLPVQLSGIGTTWRLNNRASSGHVEGGRSCAERCRIEQTVAVVETRTDDTHCNRLAASSVRRGRMISDEHLNDCFNYFDY